MHRQEYYQASTLDQLYSHLETDDERTRFISALENADKEKVKTLFKNLLELDEHGFQSLISDLNSDPIKYADLLKEAFAQLDSQNAIQPVAPPQSKKDNFSPIDLNAWEKKFNSKETKPLTNKEVLEKIRELFDDPITYELIKKPVITPQGSTYEIQNPDKGILQHIKTAKTDPQNSSPLAIEQLRPNNLYTALHNYYFENNNVDVLSFPPCLLSQQTSQPFIQPVVKATGITVEFSSLEPKEREAFYTESVSSNGKITVTECYRNLLARDIIDLVYTARANNKDKLQQPMVSKQNAPHPNGVFSNNHPQSTQKRYEQSRNLNAIEIHYVDLLSKALVKLIPTRNIDKTKIEAMSLLIDVLRNKANPQELYSNDKKLNSLKQDKLTSEVLTYIDQRTVKLVKILNKNSPGG